MASHYTHSRTRGPNDVEPDDVEPDLTLDSTIVRPEVEAAGESEPSGLAGPFQMETQVEGQMLTPQPDMETSTSPSAVALPGSGIIHLDSSASAAAVAARGALPPTAAGTQQQTPHIHHASTSRQAPALETPVLKVLHKSAPRSRQITTPAPHHSVFTGRMPFLPPNQRRQSTEGIYLPSPPLDSV